MILEGHTTAQKRESYMTSAQPARVILDWIGGNEEIIPDESLATFAKIFGAVNQAFKV
jgi:hypothetical protein